MALVKPFRAIRYNPDRIPDLRAVVSQPYDRISDDLQERYYQLSPYNIVRIIGQVRNRRRARDRHYARDYRDVAAIQCPRSRTGPGLRLRAGIHR